MKTEAKGMHEQLRIEPNPQVHVWRPGAPHGVRHEVQLQCRPPLFERRLILFLQIENFYAVIIKGSPSSLAESLRHRHRTTSRVNLHSTGRPAWTSPLVSTIRTPRPPTLLLDLVFAFLSSCIF